MDELKGFAWQLEIPEVGDVIVGELEERGDWVVADVITNAPWPVKAQKVRFRNKLIWIIPLMKGYYPAVAVKMDGDKDRASYERLLMQFLTVLSWVEEKGYSTHGIGGGSLPAPSGRDKSYGFAICDEFDLSYFPEPSDDKALLAMALMREGRALNHAGYAFLTFYRVIELALGKGKGNWIGSHLDLIVDRRGKDAITKLRAQSIADVGLYLFNSGRNAMAHGEEGQIVDPDDPVDNRRMEAELPIMSSLAELAIEEVFGIETSGTVWRKHLYELAGFKEILGSDVVTKVTAGVPLPNETKYNIPNIDIRLHRRAPYDLLSNLVARKVHQIGTSLFILFESEQAKLKLRLQLAFPEERLEFNLFNDVALRDSGTAEDAEAIAEGRRFQFQYFGNGKLQIYDSKTGDLISRKDAYLPENMWLDHKEAEQEIAEWKRVAEERRKAATQTNL
jgi:hypothetical protein